MRPLLPQRSFCHLALKVKNLEECTKFYKDLLGMKLLGQPTVKQINLTNGQDDLALVLS